MVLTEGDRHKIAFMSASREEWGSERSEPRDRARDEAAERIARAGEKE